MRAIFRVHFSSQREVQSANPACVVGATNAAHSRHFSISNITKYLGCTVSQSPMPSHANSKTSGGQQSGS